MPVNFEKAAAGSRTEMKALYEETKKPLQFLLRLLLPREEAAPEAFSLLMKEILEALPAEKPGSLTAFRDAAARRAAKYARAEALKEDKDALRMPRSKDFAITDFSGEPLPLGRTASAALRRLPTLQRWVFVLSSVCHFSDSDIAVFTGVPTRFLAPIHATEEKNILGVLSAAGESRTVPDLRAFEGLLREEARKELLSPEADAEADAVIEKVAAPLEAAAAARRKRNTLIGCAAAAVVVVCAAAGILAVKNTRADESTRTGAAEPSGQAASEEAEASETAASGYSADGSYTAEIEIENYGTVTVALDNTAAPATVENFVELAESGFYDGLTFHRIIDGFMMQGGDPNGDGTGGSGTNIVGEFSANGYDNPLSHTAGAVSMARSSDYDSASSQFFIVDEDSTYLDGQYAVFGYVTDGMDIVHEICDAAEPTDSNGTIAAGDQPVIRTIRILEASDAADADSAASSETVSGASDTAAAG